MTRQTLPLPDSAVPGLNTRSEVWKMDWDSCMQPGMGRGAVGHEVNVETIKPETSVGLDPDQSQPRFRAGRQSCGVLPL